MFIIDYHLLTHQLLHIHKT